MAKFTGHTITSDSALGDAKIQRSLRFTGEDSNDHYLQRTPSSAGNRQVCTFSCWTKRSNFVNHCLASAYSANNDNDNISIIMRSSSQDGELRVVGYNYNFRITNRLFRDFSAWYHIVVAFDTTQSSADDRVKVYVNGVQETSFSTSGNVTQNMNIAFNDTSVHRIGTQSNAISNTADGYIAEVNFIDGYQYDPSYFGFTDPVTNIWMPKRYEGTYGTNGYYLDFSDNSSAAALGIDKSPNGNDFTVNNIAVTDSMIDTPTNNFATFNPILRGPRNNGTDSSGTFSEGNLKLVLNGTGDDFAATMSVSSGKWYHEVKLITAQNHGAGWTLLDDFTSGDFKSSTSGIVNEDGHLGTAESGGSSVIVNNGSTSAASVSFSDDDIIGFAFNIDDGSLQIYHNGSLISTITGIAAGTYVPIVGDDSSTDASFEINFGQQPFTHTQPTGYRKLCSRNLPVETSIIRPQRHFEAITYSGNGSARSITGLEFKPDFVWIKERTASTVSSHRAFDIIRGAGNVLIPDGTSAELDRPTELTSFDKNGFSLGDATTVNENGSTVVAWCWKAGGTAVTNNDGSIASSVSANQEAGFSIVVYTGNGSSDVTIGHGLGKTPNIMWVKNRADTSNWSINGNAGGRLIYGTNKMQLHSGAALSADTNEVTAANATTFTLGDSTATNGQNDSHVAYCWTEIPGFSKFNVYTGNGSTNGAYVHLGFRPACIIIFNTSADTSHVIYDNKRSPINLVDEVLYPSSTSAEGTGANEIDFLSSGFKHRSGDSKVNSAGSRYIYMAWAEQTGTTPFDTFPNAR